MATAQEIYSKYTHGFVFPGGKSVTGGLRKNDSIFFSSKYDEPTYLTFRLEFDFDCDDDYALATMNNGMGYQQYNEMPHPLFNIIMDDVHGTGAKNTYGPDIVLRRRLQNNEHIFNDAAHQGATSGNIYSAYNYLKYSLGEDKRASMLLQLKAGLYDIQNNYPFYIKSIEGLSELMKVETDKGIRIPEERNTLTLKCEEGVDMKITQVLQLYRKIVWDDVYQRWVLPDMMRFFKMKIIISEMRLFHSSNTENASDGTVPSPAPGMALPNMTPLNIPTFSDYQLVSDSINELLPTICIECTQCTFDLEDTMSHINTMSSSKDGADKVEPVIKIHVGNILETHSYKLNIDTDTAPTEESRRLVGEAYYKYSDRELYNPVKDSTPDYDEEGFEDNENYTHGYRSDMESITSSLSRLGYDAREQSYSKDDGGMELDIFENKVADLTGDLMAWNQAELLNTVAGRPRSTATSYRYGNGGPISALINRAAGYVSGTIGTMAQYGIDRLMAIPIGNGYRLGDVWSSITTGDVGYLFNMIHDAIHHNDALNQYSINYGQPQASGEMVRIILQNVVDSAATHGGLTPFEQVALEIVNNPSVATDATNMIADIYNTSLKGVTNEAIDDKDNGYTDPGLVQPGYQSTANDLTPKDFTDPANKGLSNEAVEDNDKGYTDPGLVQPGYVSTANTGTITDDIDPVNKGLSNEVVDDVDNGYSDPGLVQPGYQSTANTIPLVDRTDQWNKGLSNEAIDDLDNGYSDPGMVQPDYQSTANTQIPSDDFDPANRGLSNEVIDDLDSGYSDPGLVQPAYRSTANLLVPQDNFDPANRGLSNEVIDDTDNGYSDPGLDQPDYQSTANELNPIDKANPVNRGLSNEAIDDLDNGYSDPGLKNPPFVSTATSGRKINWRGIKLVTS